MKTSWLPKIVYELLPVIYVIAAVGGLYIAGRNLVAMISAGALIIASLTIWYLRQTYRGEQRRKEAFERARRAQRAKEMRESARINRQASGDPR